MSYPNILRRYYRWIIAPVAFAAAGAMALHHLDQILDGLTSQELIFAASFIWLLFVAVLPYFHNDVIPSEEDRARLRYYRINVMIPAHNEDPEMFLRGLNSILAQTLLPARIHVVENGYAERKLEAVFNEWKENHCPSSVEAFYDLLPTPSKRQAQVFAWEQDPEADIWATIDSDVQLDPEAIERGVAPFLDPKVTSVAGLLIGLNHRVNLLTRLIEGPYVNSSIGGRAAYSMIKSVNVNCGALAFYRAEAVRKYLEHYLNHTVLGRSFSYGDDAMMTRYALNEGHAVIQNGSWGYTLHPVNIKHLTKQRLRWWRSFYWGNEWLLSFFSPKTPIWWLTVFKFASMVGYAVVVPLIVIYSIAHEFSYGFLLWGVLAAGFLSQLRYFMIKRPDESFWSQLYTVALFPLSSLLNVYLGWVLQYVGLFTFLKTGWSTRKAVEVGVAVPARAGGHRLAVSAIRRYGVVGAMAAFIALAGVGSWAALSNDEQNIVPPVIAQGEDVPGFLEDFLPKRAPNPEPTTARPSPSETQRPQPARTRQTARPTQRPTSATPSPSRTRTTRPTVLPTRTLVPVPTVPTTTPPVDTPPTTTPPVTVSPSTTDDPSTSPSPSDGSLLPEVVIVPTP